MCIDLKCNDEYKPYKDDHTCDTECTVNETISSNSCTDLSCNT